jgi:hypothetical protein
MGLTGDLIRDGTTRKVRIEPAIRITVRPYQNSRRISATHSRLFG